MGFSLDDIPDSAPTPAPSNKEQVFFHGGMNVSEGTTDSSKTVITSGRQAPSLPTKSFSLDDVPDAPVKVEATTPVATPHAKEQAASFHLDDVPEAPAPHEQAVDNSLSLWERVKNSMRATADEGNAVATKSLDQDVKKAVDEQTPFMPDAMHVSHSPVGYMMDKLAIPLRMETAALVKGLDVFTPGIQKKLNPDGSIAPDIAMNDVINYYTPTPEQVQSWTQGITNSPMAAATAKGLYWGLQTGLGMAANVYADPLVLAKLGVYTHTAEGLEAYKAGHTVGPEGRYAISMQLPFDRKRGMAAAPVVDMAQDLSTRAKGMAAKIPGSQAMGSAVSKAAQTAGQLMKSLHPSTGNDQLDMARSAHKAIMRGDVQAQSGFLNYTRSLNLSPAEQSVVGAVTESTPNIRPGFVTDAMAKKPSNLKHGLPEAEVQKMIRDQIGKHAERLGVRLDPGKAEAIERGAMAIKKYNQSVLERQVEMGILKASSAHKNVIENYLVHKMSPEAEAFLKAHPKDPELAASFVEAQETKKLQKGVGGKTLMSFNPNKNAREIRSTLEEANRIMKEKTGVNEWFQTNPFVSSAESNSRTLKFTRDKKLLDTISQYGVQPRNAQEKRELLANGWKPILHPEFEGKQVVIKKFDEPSYREAKGMSPDHVNQKQFTKSFAMNYHDVLFPGEVAEKISYDIVPRAMGAMTNVNAYMDSYNRVFRTTTLFRPDYYLTNWTGNVIKNMVNGVKMEDWVDAANALMGKPGTTYSVVKNGVKMERPIEELRAIIDKWNVKSTHFNEDLESMMHTGKKVAAEKPGIFSRVQGAEKLKQVLTTMNKVGERGENLTRIAMFVNRIKEGYTPERAAFEVEKFLFDFGRTTNNLDFVRRWGAPFIQHAIKTAAVAPELIGKAPGVWNAWHNTIPHTLQAAFNDPIKSSMIAKIMPSYFKNQDRIAGPLFPGNVWLAANAQADQDKKQGNKSMIVALGLPGGMEIMNQFGFFFDGDIARQDSISPVIRSLAIMFAGKDPWDGKDIDVTKSDPEPLTRLNWAVKNFVMGAVNTPTINKIVAANLGLKESNYYEGATIAMWNGMMGRFAKITDLDKELNFRLIHLAANEKALRSALMSQAAREKLGHTADIRLANAPDAVRNSVTGFQNPENSLDLMNRLQITAAELSETQLAGRVLSKNPPSTQEIANMIKNIQKAAHDANLAYQLAAKRYLEMANEARAKKALTQ